MIGNFFLFLNSALFKDGDAADNIHASDRSELLDAAITMGNAIAAFYWFINLLKYNIPLYVTVC